MKISQLIRDLKNLREREGDTEFLVATNPDKPFDGEALSFSNQLFFVRIPEADDREEMIMIVPSDSHPCSH